AEGELELSIVPIAWNFNYPPPGYSGNPSRMKCITQLKDGHGVPVDGGQIVFYSTRGIFYYVEFPENLPPPSTQYFGYYATTGPDTTSIWEEPNGENTGTCWMYLLTQYEQAFPDPNAIETTGQVHCEVVGYYDVSSDPITVTYTQSP
ncbi:MAG: hypothetical protein ABH878_06825, partial [bacterium]